VCSGSASDRCKILISRQISEQCPTVVDRPKEIFPWSDDDVSFFEVIASAPASYFRLGFVGMTAFGRVAGKASNHALRNCQSFVVIQPENLQAHHRGSSIE
jgi:hypothetical protein